MRVNKQGKRQSQSFYLLSKVIDIPQFATFTVIIITISVHSLGYWEPSLTSGLKQSYLQQGQSVPLEKNRVDGLSSRSLLSFCF